VEIKKTIKDIFGTNIGMPVCILFNFENESIKPVVVNNKKLTTPNTKDIRILNVRLNAYSIM
jgi:hypothetical protein